MQMTKWCLSSVIQHLSEKSVCIIHTGTYTLHTHIGSGFASWSKKKEEKKKSRNNHRFIHCYPKNNSEMNKKKTRRKFSLKIKCFHPCHACFAVFRYSHNHFPPRKNLLWISCHFDASSANNTHTRCVQNYSNSNGMRRE